ncbi:hypothetical protein M758_6G011000 [Ceratodon purpureus]|nr:hypothetical protein M758_6G011000 [Ceratodon purpureus]
MKRPANPTEYVVTSPSTQNFIRISSSIRVHQVLPVLAVVGNQILLRYPKPTHQHDYYKETHTHRVLQSDPLILDLDRRSGFTNLSTEHSAASAFHSNSRADRLDGAFLAAVVIKAAPKPTAK